MVQNSTTMSSAAAAAAQAKRGVVSSLQGPRPLPLSLPGTTTSSSPPPRPAKRPRVVVGLNGGDNDGDDDVSRAPHAAPGPVILYEHTPKVIHARPDEFKALVQRLTGRQRTTGTAGGGDQVEVVIRPAQTAETAPALSSQQEQDPLVLTLAQQHVPPPLPLVVDDHHTPPVVLLPPSPPGGAAGFLLSPSSFLFSPATMQAIQELIS